MCCRENKRGAGKKSFGQTLGGRPGWLVNAGMSCGGRLREFSLRRPSQVGEAGPPPGICVWLCSGGRGLNEILKGPFWSTSLSHCLQRAGSQVF